MHFQLSDCYYAPVHAFDVINCCFVQLMLFVDSDNTVQDFSHLLTQKKNFTVSNGTLYDIRILCHLVVCNIGCLWTECSIVMSLILADAEFLYCLNLLVWLSLT